MQKIDAHSHVGYFGGWADVGYTDEQMVAEMDRYGCELYGQYCGGAGCETFPRSLCGDYVG